MKYLSKSQTAGFTIIELIVVIVIIGIISAIAAPSWLAFLNRQRLNDAQAETLSALREAQANAKKQKRDWEVCIQDDSSIQKVRWFVRPVLPANPTCATNPGPWNDMAGTNANKIAINANNSSINNGFYNVQFQYNGWVSGQQPNNDNSQDVNRITFTIRGQNNSGSKRCVYVATLLGAVRTGSDNECN